jgi:hypothetical protein
MIHVKLIKYFYLGLTLLVLICPVKLSFIDFLPGLILMWFFYFLFFTGTRHVAGNPQVDLNVLVVKDKSKYIFLVALFYLIFYPVYIKFYTGSSVVSAITASFNGVSNYELYQKNFADSNLSDFSLSKLPLILGHGCLRFLFIVIVFRSIAYKERMLFLEKISIFIMAITIIIVGLARGTSFELFELFIIFIFGYVSKRVLLNKGSLFPVKTVFRLLFIVFLLSSYFVYNINVRMGDAFDYLELSDFDKNAIIYSISKPLAVILYSLYGYFLFGLYFNSVAIVNLWFTSFSGFFSVFIPSGIAIFGIESDYRKYVSRFIDVGAMWHPDSIVYIESFGIILTMIMIYLIGRFSKKIYGNINNDIASLILLFFVFYIFLSMPMGNFISSSSANKIVILLALICYKFKLLKIE